MAKFQTVPKKLRRKKIRSKYIFSAEELKSYLKKNEGTEWLIRRKYIENFLEHLRKEEKNEDKQQAAQNANLPSPGGRVPSPQGSGRSGRIEAATGSDNRNSSCGTADEDQIAATAATKAR